jgi:hypothetical protein
VQATDKAADFVGHSVLSTQHTESRRVERSVMLVCHAKPIVDIFAEPFLSLKVIAIALADGR